MNTAVQVKTHNNKSASKKNIHILREADDYKNIDIEILKKSNDYKFKDIVSPVPRADVKSEKERQSELRNINNKINTYSKRLEVFRAQNNTKKIESLSKQIEELNLQKEHLKEIKSAPESRGKKKTQNYVEFELSITKSNEWLHNAEMQNALKRATARLQKTKVFKELEVVTEVLHKDQYSLHVHLLTKLPDGKTWDSILKEQVSSNKSFKNGRDIYKNISNTFQKLVKEEILNSKIENKHSLIKFSHSKGKRYFSLKEYKRLNPLQATKKENTYKDMDLKKRLDLIALEAQKTAKETKEKEKASTISIKQQNQTQEKDRLEEFVEKYEVNQGDKSDSSILENKKEAQKEEEIDTKTAKKRRSR